MALNESGYGLWFLVIVNALVFIIFAASFFHPKSERDWKALGGFSAFIVALFVEMYGFPLTIYLLTGWLGSRFPQLTLTHEGGHLWSELLGWQGDPHLSPFHLVSYVLIGGGFWLLAAAWSRLWQAARDDTLATTGPYAWVRHPQYCGFMLIMAGFLLQWPTIPTLVMFPILVVIYRRLALSEERAVREQFESDWDDYAARIPRFVPHLQHRSPAGPVLTDASKRTGPAGPAPSHGRAREGGRGRG
jgi:protein-S-isoprenylcysteine O-methyltransferase Ste14